MPGCQPRLHLPYDQWPAEDQRLWERAVNNDDPFGDAAGAHLATASRKTYLFAWRRFLGFLALEEPAALDTAPAERLTMERVRRFASHLAETNLPQSLATQVDGLYKAARIMMPEGDWTWLKAIKARLSAVPPERGPTRPVITSLPLLNLGLGIMDERRPMPGGRLRLVDAVRYRDGLMIALLAFMPIRRRNVAAIEIGRHFVREGDGWCLLLPAVETKSKRADEFEIPELLKPYVAIYLDAVRPRLLRGGVCSALWISRKGGPLSYSAIWFVMARHSIAGLGMHVAPHHARNAAVTTWAVAKPAEIHVSRDLLSHASVSTTGGYNLARGIEASRTYAQLIAKSYRARHARGDRG